MASVGRNQGKLSPSGVVSGHWHLEHPQIPCRLRAYSRQERSPGIHGRLVAQSGRPHWQHCTIHAVVGYSNYCHQAVPAANCLFRVSSYKSPAIARSHILILCTFGEITRCQNLHSEGRNSTEDYFTLRGKVHLELSLCQVKTFEIGISYSERIEKCLKRGARMP